MWISEMQSLAAGLKRSLSVCLFLLEGRPLNLWFANFPFKHGTLFIKQNLTSVPGSAHDADESRAAPIEKQGVAKRPPSLNAFPCAP